MLPLKTNIVSVLHINDAVTPGGSLVVMDSLVKATTDEKILNSIIIAETPEKLDITLGNIKYDVVRPKYSYLEHSQLIKNLNGKNKFYRIIRLFLFEVKKIYSNYIYLYNLISIIKQNKFDLVHIHSAVLPCIACIITRTPYIYHLHGLHAKYSKLSLYLINSANVILAISKYIAKTATQIGINKNKIQVIANPLRPSPLPKAINTNGIRNADDILIGHFGRIVPWKGQLEFIQAFALAKKKIPQLVAIIVGEVTDGNDSYLQLLLNKTRELKIENSVKFIGYKNNTQDYYNICDIIIHSSIEPEPFGLVIIEAMASGKVTIASSLGAGPEIIENNITGLIADPKNIDTLSKQIVKLAASKDLRELIGAKAKQEACKKYSLTLIAKKFSHLYRTISLNK